MAIENSQNESIYLSVIVPAYNEEGRIEKTVISIVDYLSRQEYSYELIVVNDGSTDKTAEVISRMMSDFTAVRLIDRRENRGKGFVVKEGMLNATGEIRLFMDADNSTSIDHFSLMAPWFRDGFDMVIGSRRVEGAVISLHQSWFRENIGKVFNLFIRIVHGLNMYDTQAGFKAFSAAAAQEIFARQTVWRWVFDVELLVIARQLGYGIKEVPIAWRNDPCSNVKASHTIRTLFDIIKVKFNAWFGFYD